MATDLGEGKSEIKRAKLLLNFDLLPYHSCAKLLRKYIYIYIYIYVCVCVCVCVCIYARVCVKVCVKVIIKLIYKNRCAYIYVSPFSFVTTIRFVCVFMARLYHLLYCALQINVVWHLIVGFFSFFISRLMPCVYWIKEGGKTHKCWWQTTSGPSCRPISVQCEQILTL